MQKKPFDKNMTNYETVKGTSMKYAINPLIPIPCICLQTAFTFSHDPPLCVLTHNY